MNTAKDIFETAYLETIYVLIAPNAIFNLKIGWFHAGFDTWLTQNHITTWVKMTAANPYSMELSVAENSQRNELLRHELNALGYKVLYGSEGRPPTGQMAAPRTWFFRSQHCAKEGANTGTKI
ncbi:MAG: DUF3293 domain-containing protein [Saprospiraceae bacterium]|nr:DUF3293 domain-containing protein [Saprospiraceae bacterium]